MSNAPQKEYPAEKLLYFNFESSIVTRATNIIFSQYTNGFTVRNSGNTLLWAAGVLLSPGESMAVGGNRGEIFAGRLDLRFALQASPPSDPVNEATITQKFYTNIL
jgi:hypothetical protein